MADSTASASTSGPTIGTVARAWIVILGAGLAAAMLTRVAGESMMIGEIGMGSRGGRTHVSPVVYKTRNGMTCLGLLGGSLGLGLGLAGGALGGSARSAGVAGLVGLVLGGAAGAGAASVLIPFSFSNDTGANLIVSLLIHGALWVAISIAAGLAFGLGIGGPRRAFEAMMYAIAEALLATIFYELGGVWLFPAAQTDRPLPTSSGSRLFAYLVVALFIGAALAFGVSRRRLSNELPAPTIS